MTRVLSLGMAVWDMVYTCKTIPNAPTKYRAQHVEAVTGGGATNAAIAISKLGGDVSLAARLGADPQGEAIRSDLKRLGVDVSQLQFEPQGQTSCSSIVVDASGERQIINFRGANLATTTDWITLPPSTNAVLADTRWPDGLARALELADQANIPGIVDVDTPLDDCDFSKATHLAFARRALSELTGTDQIDVGLENAQARFGAWVCVTDGADGCYALNKGVVTHFPVPKLEVLDTLGAGDVWHGAFALALAEGTTEIAACRFANAAAALKCTQKGVAKGMPDRATVDQMVREFYS